MFDVINKIYTDVDFKVESKEPAPPLPLCQKSIDSVVAVLIAYKTMTIKEITDACDVSESTVLRVVNHLKDIDSVDVETISIDQSRYWEVTFKCYIKPEAITKISKKPLLRAEVFKSINRLGVATVKMIVADSGVYESEVRISLIWLNKNKVIECSKKNREYVYFI